MIVRFNCVNQKEILKDDLGNAAYSRVWKQNTVQLSSFASVYLLQNVWCKDEVATFTEHKKTNPNCVKHAVLVNKEDCEVQENLHDKQSAVDFFVGVVIKQPGPNKSAWVKDGSIWSYFRKVKILHVICGSIVLCLVDDEEPREDWQGVHDVN